MRVRSRTHKRWVDRALQHCTAGYGSRGENRPSAAARMIRRFSS
jgi:hypothetical protein